MRELRPGLTVELGYVDVAEPLLADTLARLSGPVVAVPLLLGAGYHVREDIPAALATAPQVQARVARVLGPDPLLAEVLGERLSAAWPPHGPQPVDNLPGPGSGPDLGPGFGSGSGPDFSSDLSSGSGVGPGADCQAIVLAAAGSTDLGANADTARMAGILSAHTGLPVVPSYLCAGTPTPADAVAALRADGIRNIAVSGYLMSPGHFARKAAASGATATAAPLGAHPSLARLILTRYDQALADPAATHGP